MKRYKHRGLSKTKIYQQVYVLIRKADRLLVYRCSSHYCILDHDRPLSWYQSHISWISI